MIIDGLEISDWTRSVVEQVRSGGVNVVHATCGVWEDMAGAMTRIGSWRHFARQNADIVRIVHTVDDMQTAVDDDVLGIVLGFQNSSMLGDDPEMAGIFADVGIRVIQLTYNIANHLGSSCWEPHDGGLTRVGHRMVTALNDAGVLVDISHVGNVTGRDAVDASRLPIAVTHGNPHTFCASGRNKPDELINAMAARGGVIGCTLYPLFMGGADVTRTAYCQMLADLVFRASRVAGCDASIADRLAADVRHSEVHHHCGLREFVDLVEHDAAHLVRAAGEAIVPNESSPALLRRRSEDRRSESFAGVEFDALASGVEVDAALWTRVEALAVDFVLGEAILDAAESG